MRLIYSAYFFLIPFQWALSPVPGIDLAVIRVLTLLLIFLWVACGLLSKKIFSPPFLPSFFLLSFLFLASSSFLWAKEASFSERKALFLFSFLPLFLVLTSWFEESSTAKIDFLRAYVLGAFLAAVSGIFIFLSQFIVGVATPFSFLTQKILPFFLGTAFGETVATYPSLLVNISGKTLLRTSGVFPDPHMFSFYIGMAFPVAVALALRNETKKDFWRIVSITLFVADLLTFSRGGYLGLVVGAVVFLLSTSAFTRFSRSRIVIPLALGSIIVVGLFFSPIGTRLFSSFSHQDGSNVERLRLWQEALGHIAERPFLGVGLGNYPLLVKPTATYREPIYAHNLYLDIALELGLVGLFLFLSLLTCAVWWAFVVWRETSEWLPLSVVISLSLFIGHSFFETSLFSVHVLPVLLLFLASGVSYKHDYISS